MSEELKKLVADPVAVAVAGDTLALVPVRLGQIPALLRAVAPIASEVSAGDVAAALVRNPDALLDVMAVLTGKPRAWLDALALDEAVDLASAALEVNADFFVRAVMPKLSSATGRIGALVAKVQAGADQALTGSTSPNA